MKIAIIILVSILSFLCLVYLAASISSGSLNYAQQYKFNISKAQLITSIEKFKRENNSYIPPLNYGAKDSLDNYTSNLTGYIYYSDQNSIVCFVIQSDERKVSSIYLLSINEGLQSPYYKRVNKDFDRGENLQIKKEFKERVLDKLGSPYQDKGNAMLIFWK